MKNNNENKPGLFKQFIGWARETRQMWLRRNIIKKIAKLTPVGPEIDLERFMAPGGQWSKNDSSPGTGRNFYYDPSLAGKVVENNYPFAKECEHGTLSRGTCYPKKIEYSDGSFTEIQILGNEECQKAFRELFERQMFPELKNVVCPHCKKDLK